MQSLNRAVYDIIKKNPKGVFNARDITHKLKKDKLCYRLVSTILSRMHSKGFVKRTSTQLSCGYSYSVSNESELNKLYDNYLLPYKFGNRNTLINLILKNTFDKLKSSDKIDPSFIKHNYFVNKYGLSYFQKDSVKEFLAMLVGFCMCDGYIKHNGEHAGFCFRYETDAQKFITDFKNKFKYEKPVLNLKRYKGKQSCCEVIIFGKEFTRLLNILGAPIGKKLVQPFLVPNWIYHGQNSIKIMFLSTIIGNEGSAPSSNRWRIQFVLSKTKENTRNLLIFLNQVRSMLGYFGITTSHIQLRKQPGRNFSGRFYIKGRENLVTFHKTLSFLFASEKQDILDNLILNGKS